MMDCGVLPFLCAGWCALVAALEYSPLGGGWWWLLAAPVHLIGWGGSVPLPSSLLLAGFGGRWFQCAGA